MTTLLPWNSLDPVGVYLNDHLAGATGGVELIRRIRDVYPDDEGLRELAADVSDDRVALLTIMKRLHVPVRHYKVFGGWLGEKLARFKLDESLLQSEPSSNAVLQLEAMQLGVQGKAAGWKVLKALAPVDSRVDAEELDRLIARADEQFVALEERKHAIARDALRRR